jgi:peptide/nickel transport system substrate-binding protein
MMSTSFGSAARRRRVRNALTARVCLVGLTLALLPSAACQGPNAGRQPLPSGLRIGVGVGSTVRETGLNTITNLLISDHLLSLDWSGHVVSRLAEKWEWEDNGRQLKLSLRPGVKFHNGQPFKAAIVPDIIRKEVNYPGGPRYVGFERVTEIDPVSDLVLLIRLSSHDAFLLSALASIDMRDPKNDNNATGPYQVRTRGTDTKLVRNADYYQGFPGFETVDLHGYDTPRRAWAALMSGEVDMVQAVSRESIEFFQGASTLTTQSSVRSFYVPLAFNLHHPVLKRVEVRRAIAEAIDRDRILVDALRNHGTLAENPIWPFHWAHGAIAGHTYNPKAARLRLDSIGLREKQRSPSAMPSRFQFTCLFWEEDPQYERIGLLLQRQLAEIGVDMQLRPAKLADLGKMIAAGDFDAYLFQAFGGRAFDNTYKLWHSQKPGEAAQNNGYDGADEILDRIRDLQNEDELPVALADLQQKFYSDVPAVFLVWLEITRGIDRRFSLGPPDDPDIFSNVWRWGQASTEKAER